MTNMPGFIDATRLRERYPFCSVGVHWTLSQGQPVVDPSSLSSLVDASGGFYSIKEFRRRWITGRIRKEEIRAELRAQYNRFVEVSGPPSFWNTHENFHVQPSLFQYCVAVGCELGIPAMRCHRRVTVSNYTSPLPLPLSHPLYWFKGKIIARWSQDAERRRVRMPDGRIYAQGYDGPVVDFLDDIMERVRWDSIRNAVEVVVHPATNADSELFGDLTESRLREYKALRDPGLVDRLRQHDIQLNGFEVVG